MVDWGFNDTKQIWPRATPHGRTQDNVAHLTLWPCSGNLSGVPQVPQVSGTPLWSVSVQQESRPSPRNLLGFTIKKKLGTGGIVPFVCSPCLDDASCMEGETCNYVVFPALTSRCIIIFRHHFFRLLDNLPDLKKNIPHTSNQSHYTTPELHANVKGFPPKTELKSSLHRDPAQSGLTFNEARIAIRRRFWQFGLVRFGSATQKRDGGGPGTFSSRPLPGRRKITVGAVTSFYSQFPLHPFIFPHTRHLFSSKRRLFPFAVFPFEIEFNVRRFLLWSGAGSNDAKVNNHPKRQAHARRNHQPTLFVSRESKTKVLKKEKKREGWRTPAPVDFSTTKEKKKEKERKVREKGQRIAWVKQRREQGDERKITPNVSKKKEAPFSFNNDAGRWSEHRNQRYRRMDRGSSSRRRRGRKFQEQRRGSPQEMHYSKIPPPLRRLSRSFRCPLAIPFSRAFLHEWAHWSERGALV